MTPHHARQLVRLRRQQTIDTVRAFAPAAHPSTARVDAILSILQTSTYARPTN